MKKLEEFQSYINVLECDQASLLKTHRAYKKIRLTALKDAINFVNLDMQKKEHSLYTRPLIEGIETSIQKQYFDSGNEETVRFLKNAQKIVKKKANPSLKKEINVCLDIYSNELTPRVA